MSCNGFSRIATSETSFNLSVPVPVDHARLSQLLSNLLGNALTHGAIEQPIDVLRKHPKENLNCRYRMQESLFLRRHLPICFSRSSGARYTLASRGSVWPLHFRGDRACAWRHP